MKKPKAQKNRKKYRALYMAFGGLTVAFLVGTFVGLPLIVNDKHNNTLRNIQGETIDNPPLFDEFNDTEAYFYDHFIPPENSFGAEETIFKTVNWSKFWNLFTTHSAWQLQAWHPILEEWVSEYEGENLNNWLNISKIRSDDNNSEKIILNVTNNAPIATFFRFTFGIDARVKNYVNKSSWYEYELTYSANATENYTVFFNFSDVKPLIQNETLFANHGIKNIGGKDVFWFRLSQNMSKAPLGSGQSYEIDPTFGYSGGTGDFSLASAFGSPSIGGHYAVMGAKDGTADKITVKFGTVTNGISNNIWCCLYEYADYNRDFAEDKVTNGETDKVLFDGDEDNQEIDFVFSGTKPSLSASTNYYMIVALETSPGFGKDVKIKTDGTDPDHGISSTYNGGLITTWPSPMTSESATTWDIWMYCTYTEEGADNTNPSQSSESPTNGTEDLSVDPELSVTCTDTDGDTMNATWWYNDSNNWYMFATNTTINSGTSISQTNTGNFSNLSTTYWWYVNLTDGEGGWDNDSYYFTTEIADTSIPLVTWNFAGNPGDNGGPSWNPSIDDGESIALEGGEWEHGYYTNDSHQQENWIYMNISVTEPECDIEDIYLNIYNQSDSSWDNTSCAFVNRSNGYWDVNTTTHYYFYEGHNYSFNINASNTHGLRNISYWNKTGTKCNECKTRRFVQLNCSRDSLAYMPLYVVNYTLFEGPPTYIDPVDLNSRDRLHCDQGTDNTDSDTAYLRNMTDKLTDDISHVWCSGFAAVMPDEGMAIDNTTITSMYSHIWWTTSIETGVIKWKNKRDVPMGAVGGNDNTVLSESTAKSSLEIPNNGNPDADDTFSLEVYFDDDITGGVQGEKNFTDNSIFQFTYQIEGLQPGLLCNRSIQSYIILNLPDNETLKTLDTDNDGVEDYHELFVLYTNPYYNDTDNDGIGDWEENLSGSDPNDYTDTTPYTPPDWYGHLDWNTTISDTSDWKGVLDWNTTISDTSDWYGILDWNTTISDTNEFKGIQDWNITISNTSLPHGWYDNDFNYYIPLAVDNSNIDVDITNFTVLVRIPDATGDKCNGGNSIRFVGTDNITEYPYEIEKWTDGSDRLVWVNLSYVYSSTPTEFLMYYGNGAASDNQSASETWNESYSLIMHMNNATEDEFDSTNEYQFAETSGTIADATGKVGQAREFGNGDTEYFSIDDASWQTPSKFTLSAWYKPAIEEPDGNEYFVGKYLTTGNQRCYSLMRNDGSVTDDKPALIVSEDGGTTNANSVYEDNVDMIQSWYWISGRWDGSTISIYTNDSTAGDTDPIDPLHDGTGPFTIGALANPDNYAPGIIDEVRFSSVCYNASWIKAEYYSMADTTFVSFGTEVEGEGNSLPYFSDESPTNETTDNDIDTGKQCYVVCEDDDEGDTLTVDFYENTSGAYLWVSGNTSVSPSENHSFTYSNADMYNTTYYWMVTSNDGIANSSDIFWFTTEGEDYYAYGDSIVRGTGYDDLDSDGSESFINVMVDNYYSDNSSGQNFDGGGKNSAWGESQWANHDNSSDVVVIMFGANNDDQIDNTATNLMQIYNYSLANGSTPYICITPLKGDDSSESIAYQTFELNSLMDYMENSSIPYIKMFDAIDNTPWDGRIGSAINDTCYASENNIHPNATGHLRMAEFLNYFIEGYDKTITYNSGNDSYTIDVNYNETVYVNVTSRGWEATVKVLCLNNNTYMDFFEGPFNTIQFIGKKGNSYQLGPFLKIWQGVLDWNITISDTSSFKGLLDWNITISNSSDWFGVLDWNVTISNTSVADWKGVLDWNTTISDTSEYQGIMDWNTTISNSSDWFGVLDWNLTISNSNDWYGHLDWNTTISNLSSEYKGLLDWNTTISNYTGPHIPNPPDPFIATTVNNTKIDLSWTHGNKADYTIIYNHTNEELHYWDNYTDFSGGEVLYNGGTNQGRGERYTSFTGRPLSASFYLTRTGSPDGNMFYTVRYYDNNTILANGSRTVTDLATGTPQWYTITWDNAPELYKQDILVSIEYYNGDVDNLIAVGIGDTNRNTYRYTEGSWESTGDGIDIRYKGYNGISIVNTTDTSYSATGLETNTRYYYYAWGYNVTENLKSDNYSYASNITVGWKGILDWNVTISDTSEFKGILDWNTTISNLSSDFKGIQDWNITISDTSEFKGIQDWNVTISNSSNWQGVQDWNITISDTSSYKGIQDWNVTISNTSEWLGLQEWNITISDTSEYQGILDWNTTISNETLDVWQGVLDWNITISDTSEYKGILDWNLTISNSNDWFGILDWNLTISDTSSYKGILDWNLTISNQGNWYGLQDWNITISDTSEYQGILDWNTTISNETLDVWQGVLDWNITISDTSEFKGIQDWNVTISDTSGWYGHLDWNITISNNSDWYGILDWNTTISNSSELKGILDWNLTISNQGNWYGLQDWNITISDTSNYQGILDWNLTISNLSSEYKGILDWNLTISNSSEFKGVQDWNVTISNSSNWQGIQDWNITISDTSSYKGIIDWNLTISNSNDWFGILDWNLTLINSSEFKGLQDWNITISNTSEWLGLQDWVVTITNTSDWYGIQDWVVTITNTSNWIGLQDWNVTISNVTGEFKGLQDWNITISNTSEWLGIQDWNITISDTSSFKGLLDWNLTLSNESEWSGLIDWNITLSNLSSMFKGILDINLTISNSSNWYGIMDWNITISDTSSFLGIQDWNITISNLSSEYKGILDWNITISNSSIWNGILDWNLTISDTSNYQGIMDWNLTISHTGGFLGIQDWNITIGNSTVWKGIIDWNLTIINGTGTIAIVFTEEYPGDDTVNVPLQPTSYVTINSTFGEIMNVSWYYGLTEATTINHYGTDTNFTNSTQHKVYYPASSRLTDYYWRLQADDGEYYYNQTYNFRTEGYTAGGGSGGGGNYMLPLVFGAFGIILGVLSIIINKKRRNKL